MLLTLLYHRIGNNKFSNPLSLFKEHLEWIANHYPTTFPGDHLPPGRSLCLTFDDATFDFYHYLFPLLQKWKLKAVLAVPVDFIQESTSFSTEERLQETASCTWDEIKEMHTSSLIHIASHSLSHRPLTSPDVDPVKELTESKAILEAKLDAAIDTFVYPFGIFNDKVHRIAKKHYRYIMRIGNACNWNWTNRNGLHYRVPTDALSHYRAPFTFSNQVKYLLRFLFNISRNK
jgi:peptidoglycan/xylan/chitin deacetylase (PgdA/CDA1 family)